mgnify:CR=1 FL=1
MIRSNRRALLMGALGATAGTAILPWATIAQQLGRGFTHGVASGEPGADRILLWTRYVPAEAARIRVRHEVAEDEGFTRIVARGASMARADRDYSVKPEVMGLRPGRTYYYRFLGEGGEVSPVGRTRTLPAGRPEQFTIALFSCSNKPFGFFNAYAHAAARDDIDLAIHVGDYIYEYYGTYPTLDQALPGREIEPRNEILSLADYRLRYASYRVDPDLQALHARLPMVSMWDDHELTNDAWKGGAQNHQPETEGPWEVRKAAAVRAYREWMPTSESLWRAYRAGDLVSFHRIESRITGRDQQLSFADVLKDARDPAAALAAIEAFARGPLADPRRQMLGAAQERWLLAELGRSVQATRWQTLINQVLMGSYLTPPEAGGWLPAGAPDFFRRRYEVGLLAARAGLPGWLDSWAGYPAARDRILKAARAWGASFVSIAGDTHNAWAFNLAVDGQPAGVEFGGQSVTSPGLESAGLTATPDAIAEAIVRASPGLAWCNTHQRGYTTVRFERDRVTATYHLLEGVRERSTALAGTRTIICERGSQRLTV